MKGTEFLIELVLQLQVVFFRMWELSIKTTKFLKLTKENQEEKREKYQNEIKEQSKYFELVNAE